MMASPKDVVLSQFELGQYLIEQFTKDLSDKEYFHVPAKGANHAGWIMGHIAVSEDSLTAAITGKEKSVPDATAELFKGGSSCVADASKYPSRKEIEAMFQECRSRTVEALKAFDDGRWNEASPEAYQKWFPTLGVMWALQGSHQYWHIGQLTVCRQSMNKPRALGG
jgi:hypothetical protein